MTVPVVLPPDLRARAPLSYRLLLDSLDPDLATFTWAAGSGPASSAAVLAVPRTDWEDLGRPGFLEVDLLLPTPPGAPS